MAIKIKRVYDPPAASDGIRVLVDRLWPRGISKEKARVNEWIKEIAPSDRLRQWFGHKPERWHEFQKRYCEELKSAERLESMHRLRALAKKERVTLLYAARDSEHNNAVVLAGILRENRRSWQPKKTFCKS